MHLQMMPPMHLQMMRHTIILERATCSTLALSLPCKKDRSQITVTVKKKAQKNRPQKIS